MATVAVLGQGVLLQVAPRGDTSPFAYETIADVLSIRGPTGRADQIDVTSHSSPSGSREFIAGLRDPGELSFGINMNVNNLYHKDYNGLTASPYDPDGLAYMFRTGGAYNFRLRFAQFSPILNKAFVGQVIGYEQDIPVDAQLRADITVRLSGLITENAFS